MGYLLFPRLGVPAAGLCGMLPGAEAGGGWRAWGTELWRKPAESRVRLCLPEGVSFTHEHERKAHFKAWAPLSAPCPFLEASVRPRFRDMRVCNLISGPRWDGSKREARPQVWGHQVDGGVLAIQKGQLQGLGSFQHARDQLPQSRKLLQGEIVTTPSFGLTLIPPR